MMDDVGQTLHDLPASSGSQSNRDFPARGDHSECCTSLQTRVSSALFQNYRCEDTSIVTESAAGAGWIGAITLQYIGLVHIPSVRCVCRDAYNAVQVPWQYVRNSPRDGITLMNDRCTLCGWFTGAKSAEDASLCCECNNTGVCSACSYVAADGRRLCGECELEEGSPHNLQSIIQFFDNSRVHDALDYLQTCGNHALVASNAFMLRDRGDAIASPEALTKDNLSYLQMALNSRWHSTTSGT
jgi:hypothetical protein